MEDKLEQLLDDMSETSSEIANTWCESNETLLSSVADRANCSSWMHERCSSVYESYHFYLTIPSIAISGIAGFTSLLSTNLIPSYYQELGSYIVGLASLACGVLQSINQVLKSQQRAEEHRTASIAYGKMHRAVASELAIRRDQRLHALDFLRVIRTEQDRLQETSPPILDRVKKELLVHIGDAEIVAPETVGIFQAVRVYTDAYKPMLQSPRSPRPRRSDVP